MSNDVERDTYEGSGITFHAVTVTNTDMTGVKNPKVL